MCAEIPTIETKTRLAIVSHFRELYKTTSTGYLALEAMPNSELYVHGKQESPLNLKSLHDGKRRIMVLFPSEKAKVLTKTLISSDPRPITLIVPDGNWRQASRIPKRVPGLAEAEHVILPDGKESEWGVREETRPGGLATLEAISRAFAILESQQVGAALEQLFHSVATATLFARGMPKRKKEQEETLKPLQIVFQDELLVAVNKPSGQLVHPGWARDGVSALEQLRDQLGRFVYPVHRIDRATSGIVLFALSSEMAADIQRQFQKRKVDKRYLALVRGNSPKVKEVNHPLSGDSNNTKKEAITKLQLLGTYERFGLVAASPITGRLHQIRRHLKHISHPIIGDVRYGKGHYNRLFREEFNFHRLALHHQRMIFTHPRSNVRVSIHAELQEDFRSLLHKLELLESSKI